MDYIILTNLKVLRGFHIFDFITLFGDIKILFFIICAVYWKNSKLGLKLISSTLMATNASQIFKLIFSIPRPFLIYKNINPSNFALSSATGFSFPSGHSQLSMSIFGFLAENFSNFWLYLIPFLVAFSRLVLGVHTLKDVVFGLIIGIIFIKLTTGNLLVFSLITLLFSAFKYIKGVPIAYLYDNIATGIISLIFLILLPYIANNDYKLTNKKILIGLLPLILSKLIFTYLYPIHNLEYIIYIIYMFIFPKKASKI